MKKVLACILSLVLVLGMIAPAALADDGKTTVVFWNSWTGGDGDTLQALVDKFNAENDHIFIDMTRTTSFGNMLQTALPTKEAADLILLDTNGFNTYEGYLLPMDDIFETTALKKEDFAEGYLNMCYHSDGKLYGIPFQIITFMMYYNRDLFTAAGLDPDQPPKTFAQWTEYAEKISALSTDDKPIYGSGLFYCYDGQNASVLERFGTFSTIDQVDGEFKPVLVGNEKLTDALLWMKDLYARGINPLEKDIDSMMAAGQIGIMDNGGWLKGTLDASGINYGIAKLPTVTGEDVDEYSLGTMSVFSLTTSATDETAAAAKEFIEWWIATGKGLEASDLTGGTDYSGITPNAEWSISMAYLNAYLPCINSAEYQANELLKTMTPSPTAKVAMYTPAGCLANSQARTVLTEYVQQWIFDMPADATKDDLNNMLADYQQDLQDAIDEHY
ncbi:MAG: extracellular solute-binding protein [Clostridium sp.]|nr:extracellular solute-binding protein [Clostridium sp.]